jgi:5'-3' exonuclease
MGVKGLYSYLKHYRNYIDPRLATPKRIGIDAMSLLYRFKGDTKEIFELLGALRVAGHKLFFVFDGKPPVEKEREVQNRKEQKNMAGAKAESIKTFLGSEAGKTVDTATRDLLEYSLERCTNQSWHMTRETRRAFQDELWNQSIPYVKSLSEADDVLIDLSHAGKIDVVLTTDMDYIMGGTKVLWIPTKKDTFFFEEISLADILSGENLTQEALIDAGLLCGTEERAGAKGIPCDKAFTFMRYYGSLEAVLKGNVRMPVLHDMFPDEGVIASARATCRPSADCYSRMRPDHLERVKEFLDTL